jgi:hypothetical protein
VRVICTWVSLVAWLLLVNATAACAQTADNPEKLSAKELTQLLQESPCTTYYGGVMIASGDTLAGTIAIIAGALDIQDGGVLAGDAWVINGRAILTGSARVDGALHLINSRDYLARQAEVRGGITYYTCECSLDAEKFEKNNTLVFKKHEDPLAIKTKFAVKPGYTTEVGLERENPRHKKPHVHGHAFLHLPVESNTRGYLGFDINFAVPLKGPQLDLRVQGYKKLFSNDYWQLSQAENDWIVMLAGNNYIDYFESRGGGLGLEYHPRDRWRLAAMVSYREDVSANIEMHAWPFYPHRLVRPIPPIDEGERLLVDGALVYDTRDDLARPENAWRGELGVEKGIADGPGEFSYAAFHVDLRRYQRVQRWLQWDTRGRLFSSFDELPTQTFQSLNGYSGIRGVQDVPFGIRRGDRLALVSTELRLRLPELPVFRWLFARWNLVTFADLGLLTMAENAEAPLQFLSAPFDNWKKTVGVGISGESFLPYLAVYVAQEIDGERKNPRVIIRAARSF